jgi:hypothetical protein
LQSAKERTNDKAIRWVFSLGTMYPLALEDGTRIAKLDRHSFVNYALHRGGLAAFLPDGVPRYTDGSKDESALADPDQKPTVEEQAIIQKAMEAPSLPFHCRCGKIKVELNRPSTAPISEDDESVAVNDGWLWTFCFCSSCRATSGFDNTSFCFAPYTHITSRSLLPPPPPPSSSSSSSTPSTHPTEGLKMYSSYAGRRRWFCSTCGCKFFFDREDRGDLCDLFLGSASVPVSLTCFREEVCVT